jgi:hypothetical protein
LTGASIAIRLHVLPSICVFKLRNNGPLSAELTVESFGQPAKRRNFNYLWHSTTLWLGIVLTTSWILLFNFYPWSKLVAMDIPGGLTDFAIRSANNCFNENPKDVALLGSSLILAPSQEINKTRSIAAGESWLDCHLASDEYVKVFKRRFNLDITVVNVGVPGALVSDQADVVHALATTGRAPKLLVLTYGPRDFMDNILAVRADDTPISRVFAAYTSRHFSLAKLDFESISAMADHQVKFGHLLCLHLKRRFVAYACKALHRPTSLWQAQNDKAKMNSLEANTNQVDPLLQNTPAKRLAADLANYNQRYNPPNKNTFETQMAALDDTLQTCKSNNIPTVVVSMPITRENLALLKPEVKAAWQNRVLKFSNKYNVSLIDMNNDSRFKYALTDFDDSVHLSSNGAFKFVNDLSTALGETKEFKAAFGSRQH